MSTTMNLQFTDEEMKQLELEAQRLGKSPAEVAARWVAETLREKEFPHIEFRDTIVGREAYVRGTRIKVWHLRMYSDGDAADVPRIAADLNLSQEEVAEAFAYAHRYSDEIDAIFAELDEISQNIEKYIPGVKIFRVDATDS